MIGSKLSTRNSKFALAIAVGLASTSCGGGGGGGGSTGGGNVATAPIFTSGSSVSVQENEAGTFYTATASDPQGDTVIISIQGGADASKFVLEGSGNLRFSTPPNYDLPIDANQDNTYQVILRATAGTDTTDLPLSIQVQNDKEGISATRVATGFVDPVAMSTLFDGQRLIIAENGGRIAEIDGNTGSVTERDDIEAGLLPGEIISMAYAGRNKIFIDGIYFLTHSPTGGLSLQIYNPANGRFNFRTIGAVSTEEVTGALFRGDDGHLFAAIGDPGGTRAQDGASAYGKVWSSFDYDPYAGASFPGNPTVFVSIIADGIGEPTGGTAISGRNLIADRGATVEDEITAFESDWDPIDFGWPFYEGYAEVASSPPPLLNGPTLTYRRGDARREGLGIVGGRLYSGAIASIADHYVFGDVNGTIWSIPWSVFNDGFRHDASDLEIRTLDFAPDVGKIDSPIAFEMTPENVLYILDSDGEVFRVDQS
ncbi:hypothetical protein [Altererythrobacter sp. MF3-039]|uniref:hypothetical protein n=1 Tax=Altererythrobacter sp. MF3-039 TaxID=3252901 RepID=UPI00390C81BF